VAVDSNGKFTGTTDTAVVAADFKQLIAKHGFSVSAEFSPASNYWAVGKGRVSEANGMLVNGPQFGFSLPSYVYGIGLHGGDFDVVGNTLLGLPSLLFAHNNHISWGSTAGMSDQVDVFVETLHPENDSQYLHNGSYREFDSWKEVIEVKDAEPVTVIARRSVHGMVQQLDSANRLAYSRARAWEGAELDSLFGWINLSRDKTLAAARNSIAKVATNINFYTMDRQGRLAYTHGGRYPLRHPQQDSRLPTPGTGEWDWQGMRPYSENPTARNGAQDIVVNWNNRPESSWVSSDLWTQTWSRADRSRFIFEELQAKSKFTVDEVWAVNRSISNRDVTAPFILPYLYEAYKQQPQSALVKQALATLQSWDSRWQHDAEGHFGSAPTIMEQWLSQLLAAVFKDDIGEQFFYLYAATNNPNHKLGPSMGTGPGSKALIKNLDDLVAKKPLSYDFFNGVDYRQVLRSSFEAALAQLQSQQGSVLSQWQLAAYPMQWSRYNFRGVPQALEPASPEAAVQLPAYQNRGSENNLFIARDNGFTAFDVIPPGQSGFVKPNGTAAENSSDQLAMYAEYRYKTVPFSRKDVARVAVSEQRITVSR
jgi:penicillin amidase